jgi:hypothetical protein
MNFLGLPYRLSSSLGSEWILPEDLTKFDSSLTNSTLRQQFQDLIASSEFILPKCTYNTGMPKYKMYNWFVNRNLKFRFFEFVAWDKYHLSETGLTPGKLNFSQVVELLISCDKSDMSEFYLRCPKLKKITLYAGSCLDYNKNKTWVLDINPDILQQLTHLVVTGDNYYFRGLVVNESDWNHIAQNCKSLVEFTFTTFNIESNNHTPQDSEIIFDTLFSNNPTFKNSL